jgi:hypothetical protein
VIAFRTTEMCRLVLRAATAFALFLLAGCEADADTDAAISKACQTGPENIPLQSAADFCRNQFVGNKTACDGSPVYKYLEREKQCRASVGYQSKKDCCVAAQTQYEFRIAPKQWTRPL